MLAIDGFLSDEALELLYKFALESTVYFDIKGGYLGAYSADGMQHPVFMKIVDELRSAMPRIFCNASTGEPLDLINIWSYKSDPAHSGGLGIHADLATVNLNLWVTPDEANLNTSSGGLHVYDYKPELVNHEDFDNVNSMSNIEQNLRRLEESNATRVTFPYRRNRAILFESSLFHQSDDFQFAGGYRNFRINFTLLFGSVELHGCG